MGLIRIGRWFATVEEGLLELASACSFVDRYRAASSEKSHLSLIRVPRGADGWIALDGEQTRPGTYAVQGGVLQTCIPDEPASAEAALRALFQLAILRQGGLLLHGSAVSFEGKAVVATGPSGAGKSTLARLCVQAGGTLLSDETVGLHPDGTVFGSPFFSDPDMIGEAHSAKLVGIFALQKGESEQLTGLQAAEGAALLLAQAYRPPPGEAAAPALLARASALALHPAAHRLTFRKHEAAGPFVKRWVLGESRRAERR
jgi:hypothetical protein